MNVETLYYLVGIAAILCGAAFRLGYVMGLNAKK